MTESTLPRRVTMNSMPGRTNAVPVAEDTAATDQDVAPPAYGEHHDQLQFSQAGFNADAAVTANGRVNIHINEKNSRLSDLLAPALKRQFRADAPLPSGPLPPAYIPPSLGGLPGQTPPPRLNVVIQIVGSRGDVQPFVALGQVLRDTYGHRVRVATHANFRSFVEENGLEFFNIGGDPAQLMAFMVKNPGLMPGLDTLKSGDIKKRRQEIEEIITGCWRSCIEAGDGMGVAPLTHKRDVPVDQRYTLPGDPGNRPFVADAIIANPPSFAHIHIAEKLGIPLHMMFTMPWSPTKAFPHPLADIVATNADTAITNYVSYALVEMMTWQGLGDVINRFRSHVLELEPISLMWAPGLLHRLRIPSTYCWSPALTPKPADWTEEITVSGFFFLNLESNYTPEPELAAYLAAGPPPVYIGFGSIVVEDPDGLTQTIFNAVRKSGVRAIVSKGWGGIGGDAAGVPEGVFMLGNCPHDWLFRQVSAVVHHGGAGTTAAGIMAGCPTVVVPFFGDQIFWGSMVAKAGAGPAPIPYKKLTADNLAEAIQFALQPQTQAKARELGEKIKQEKGADVGGKSFHQFLNTDVMRCSLAPSRVAVWRVRRSKVRLSAMAAAVLVKQEWLKYSDLKLFRPIEYNTDEQPWDPISAVTMALVGDIGAFTMAIADFPREIFKAQGKKDKGKGVEGKGKDVEGKGKDVEGKDDTAKTDDAASIAASGTTLGDASSPHQRTDSSSDIASISSPPPPSSTNRSAETLPLPSSSSSISSSSTFLQPTPTNTLGPPPPLPPRSPVNLDVAIATGKGAGRIVGAGMKFYANTCMGLARGFRNAPKLYNDDTVRPPEKVTGLVSGMKVAGKELGLGFYDGVSGLVTQPWRGAEKEGPVGFVKGVGKGLGGVFFKSASAVFAVPAYTVQGLRAEVRGMFARSSTNYIITSRVLQGEEDLAGSTAEEGRDVLARWHSQREELKAFYLLKQKEGEKERAAAEAARVAEEEWRLAGGDVATGGAGSSSSVVGGRLGLPRGPWGRRRTASSAGSSVYTVTSAGGTFPPTTASSAATSSYSFEENESLERAIKQSVEQTSTGDREEDARIEAAVRASVMEMRRAAEQQQQQQQQQPQQQQQQPPLQHGQQGPGWITEQKAAPAAAEEAAGGLTDEEWTNITEEEYQALIEEAVQQSLLQQEADPYQQWEDSAGLTAAGGSGSKMMAEQLPRDLTIPSSTATPPPQTTPGTGTGTPPTYRSAAPSIHHTNPEDANPPRYSTDQQQQAEQAQAAGEEEEDEAQLRLAIQQSEHEHRTRAEEMARQLSEEEIVLEYVKRQSLAEEEFRRRAGGGGGSGSGSASASALRGEGIGGGDAAAGAGPVEVGKGKGVGQGGGEGAEEEEDEDEELRRAIEESLRVSGSGSGAGQSSR